MMPTYLTTPTRESTLTGATLNYMSTGGVIALLADRVLRTPHAPAAQAGDTTLTYGHLWAAAGVVARDLHDAGLQLADLVAVATPRGLPWLVGLLGCWRAGGIYLPLDPTYPADRRATIRAASNIRHTLTPIELQYAIALTQTRAAPHVVWPPLHGNSPAYQIHTSGSTGRPKGVQLAHHGLCGLWLAQQFHFGLHPGDRVGQFAGPHFDASLFECLLAWSSGATLVLVPDAVRAAAGVGLRTWLDEQAISVACLTPTLLGTLPAGPLPALHTLMVAGEACPAPVAARWGRGRRFYNLGGVTEGTVWQTIGGPTSDGSLPPLGRAVAGWSLRLGEPGDPDLPTGERTSGELWIGGPGVALGYTDPTLTAARFHTDLQGRRWYRTGDLVQVEGDGRLQWRGRADEQVKLGGQRVELAEIAAALTTLPDVREATVALWQPPTGDPQLVGYLVAHPGAQPLSDRTVHQALAGQLPAAWRPTRLVWLAALPRGPHDKIERAALPPPSPTRPVDPPTLPELLGVLAELQNLLDLPLAPLESSTNLFSPAVGGDSLLVLNLVVAIEDRWGLPITSGDIYDAPTPAALIRHLQTLNAV